jgi:pantoate--beta-alanine ligase
MKGQGSALAGWQRHLLQAKASKGRRGRLQTIRTIEALRAGVAGLRHGDHRIAFVPTMGALHDGHLTLVREARKQADHVIVSIFVNPRQFGPGEDLDAYPRTETRDAAMLIDAGVSLLWAPDVATMYPQGSATIVSVSGLDAVLCGAARPGHFDGVATVVAKLFNQVQPDVALFGEKDWQQLAIIRRMVIDLDLPVEIVGVPTVREGDGLAMSSRNAYLTADQRSAAAALPRALTAAAKAIAGGATCSAALSAARDALLNAGFSAVDYLDLREGATLQPVTGGPAARLFVAARIGSTRLIDNISLTLP